MVTRGSHRVAFGSATRELQPAMPNECSVDVTCHRVPTRELQPGGWTRSPDRFILSLRAHARVATCEGSSGRNAVQTVTACPRASCNMRPRRMSRGSRLSLRAHARVATSLRSSVWLCVLLSLRAHARVATPTKPHSCLNVSSLQQACANCPVLTLHRRHFPLDQR